MLTLEDAEQKIYDHYQWFAREAPGVPVQEQGILARWWAVVDAHNERGAE